MENLKSLLSDGFRKLIGLIVVIGVFAMLFLLCFHIVPQVNREIIIQNIGNIIGMMGVVVAYEYGSSKSSADKNVLLANSQPIPPNSTTSAVTVSETKTADKPTA